MAFNCIKHYSLLILTIFFSNQTQSQSQRPIDSLKVKLMQDAANPQIINQISALTLDFNPAEADSLAQIAIHLSNKQDNKKELALAYLNACKASCYLGAFSNAMEKGKLAAGMLKNLKLYVDAAQAHNYLAFAAQETDSIGYAIVNYRKALELLRKGIDNEHIPRVMINLGHAYQLAGNNDSAFFYYNSALPLCEKAENDEDLNAVYGNIGFLHRRSGDFQKALEFYSKALDISKRANLTSGLAIDYNNIASLCLQFEKYDMAADYYRRALSISKQQGNKSHTEVFLNNLANVYLKQGNLDTALVLLSESVEMAFELGRMGNAAIRLMNMGGIYTDRGEYRLSIDHFSRGIKILRNIDRPDALANGLQSLGNTYIKVGDMQRASKAIEEAYHLASKLNMKPLLVKIHESRSKIFETQHNFEKALSEHKRYAELKDQVFSEQSQNKIEELNALFETEKKQHQIELLEKHQLLNEANLKKKQVTIMLMIVVGIVLAIVLALTFMLYLYKTKLNRKLVEKNLALLKQIDLYNTQVEVMASPRVRSEEKERIVEEFEKLLTSEGIFRKTQLTLSEMADLINTNTTYLSQVINDYYQMNFTNLINQRRVMEAQRIISGGVYKTLTLEAIAAKVGFFSRPTFNKAFKQFTGVTPSTFIKTMEELEKGHQSKMAV